MQVAAYQGVIGIAKIVSPQPELKLTDTYGNPFTAPVSVRAYIREVTSTSSLRGDQTTEKTICDSSDDCYVQAENYVQFSSLALNIDNIRYPRSYAIHFVVTEQHSDVISLVSSQTIKVPCTKPQLLVQPTNLDPMWAPAELTASSNIVIQVQKATTGLQFEQGILDCVINVSLILDSALAIGRPVFENTSKTSEILVGGKAIFKRLHLNAAGRYRMAFSASPIIMSTYYDDNHYFDQLNNFLSLQTESALFEVSPGALAQVVILQQPQDEKAVVGCVYGLSCPIPEGSYPKLSYFPLHPNPSVAPADQWGNGIGGIKVLAEARFLESHSGGVATSSSWEDGGIAIFTDITMAPTAANLLHRITFKATSTDGQMTKSVTSSEFTAGFLEMALSGHTNFETTIAGQMLPSVAFKVVDHLGNDVTSIRSQVSATVFTFDDEKVVKSVLKSPEANGKVMFADLRVEKTGRYYVRFAYLDMVVDSNLFVITPGNPVALIMKVQPNHVHVNQAVFPAPVVVMHDVFANRALPQGNLTINIAIRSSNPSLQASTSSVKVNVDGEFIVLDLRFSSVTTGVSMMFWSGESELESVVTEKFSITVTEPYTLISTMQQPSVLAAQWLDDIHLVVRDHSGSKMTAVDSGILQDGGLDFVILARSARFDDEYYTNMMLVLVSGPGAGQSTKITAFHGASRRATVALKRRASSTTHYKIQYVVKLRVASLNGQSVDLSNVDAVATDSLPQKYVPAFLGPDEAVLENGEAKFIGIWMQRAGSYALRIRIDPPAYLERRVEFVSAKFTVGPREATGFYVSPFGDGTKDAFSADETIPPFFLHMHDVYGNNVQAGTSVNTEFRLQAIGGIFAPRAPGYQIPRTNDPFTVIGSSQRKANGTVVVAQLGKAIFDGLKVETTGRGFSFFISADLYAPVTSSPFSIFPGEAEEIIVLRQPLNFKISPENQGTLPSQPRICVLDPYGNSLVVMVRVDLVRGTEKCGILESLQLQDLESMDLDVANLYDSGSTCAVDLSSNPYVDSREGIDDGTAEFTDLAVTQAGEGYQLIFKARDMRTGLVMDAIFNSQNFSVFVGEPFRFRLKDADTASFCPKFPSECTVAGDTLPSFAMILVDPFDNRVEGKDYQGLRCKARIPIFLDTSTYKIIRGENIFIPVLNGTTTVDVIEGVATFTDLVIYQISTFTGENADPVVHAGSWVIEFLEPDPEPNHPSLFPGNTFTSEPFQVVSGDFFALGINGFGSSAIYMSADMPVMEVSGVDRYGNFAPGAQGIVVVELSNVPENVILYGESPVDPEDDRLLDFKKRLIVDGKAIYDKLMIKFQVPGAILTFWLLNEVDDSIREPQVVVGPFSVNAVGTLRVTALPSTLSNAGSTLSPAPALQIVSTRQETLGEPVEANALTRVRLYDLSASAGFEWNTPLKGTLEQMTQSGITSFTDLVIEKAGRYRLVFNIIFESGDATPDSLSETFRIGPANGGTCADARPCKITILQQPPAELIVAQTFDVEVFIQDFYGNHIDTGSASIQIFNNPTADGLLGDVDNVDVRQDGHVTFTGLHTYRSCNPSWCQYTTMKGYTLRVTKDGAEKMTNLFYVDSLPFVAQYGLQIRTDQQISAGKRMKYLPRVLMQDEYDNLVVTNVPPRRWKLGYMGPGCLVCQVDPPCDEFESASLIVSLSECSGAATANLGTMDILAEAPSIIGADYTYEIEIFTWEGEPLHNGTLVSNPFSVTHTDTKFIKIINYPQNFPHLVAGEPFSIDVEMIDLHGNAVTSGILEASLLGPDNIDFDLQNCSFCTTSVTVVLEGGSLTTISLQITQMQMEPDLEIVLTHFGTGVSCTESPFQDIDDEETCFNPFMSLPESCPKQVTVLTQNFRILNAPVHHLSAMPLPSSMGAGTIHTVYLHVLDRYNNLLLDVNSLPNVDVSVAAHSGGYTGKFPQLLPFFTTPSGEPVSNLICLQCAKLYKGGVKIDFPAPLVVSKDLELVFSVSAVLESATYWSHTIDLRGFKAISNLITILPGNPDRISVASEDISNFNRFGHPLYRQPCVSVTDTENNPVAPELLVEVHICAANASVTNVVMCELAGIAETDESDQVCFSGLEISRPSGFNIGVAYYYFTFVAGSLSMRSSLFTVYDITGLQVVSQPIRSLAGSAMLPAPEVWLCFGALPCSVSSRVHEWPHRILVDQYADDGTKVPGKLVSAAIRKGVATFGNLTFEKPGNGFHLAFALQDSEFTAVSGQSFSIMSDDVVHINITAVPDRVRAGQLFDVSVDLLDFYMNPLISGATRSVTISWADECECGGASLFGELTVTAINGRAHFAELSIQKTGRFQVQVRVPGTSGMMHGVPDVIVSDNITVLHSQSYELHISQQPQSGIYGQALPIEPLLVVEDGFGNAAVDLNDRQVQAFAECVASCTQPLTVSNGLSNVSSESVIFEGLSVHLTTTTGSAPPSQIRLRFVLCSDSGDCPVSASVSAVSIVIDMSVPPQEAPQDPLMRIDVQPTSTMIANYSSSFRPQISVLETANSDGLNNQTRFTVFITLIRGQFLGSLALNSKLEKAPGVTSKVIVMDDLHAKVDTVDGRADFNGIVVAGTPGDDFQLVFTRCHLGSNLTKAITGGEMCNWIDATISQPNTRISAPFRVTNAQIFYMHILQTAYPAGQASSGRLVTLSDRPLSFGVRVDDIHQMAIGSRSYSIKAQLVNSSGYNAPAGVLQGQTAVMTQTGFSAPGAGEAFFTDLRVTKIGEGWKIRFSATPDCVVDFPVMRALACDDTFRTTNTVAALTRPIDVGHDNPVSLEFISEPRNVTSGYVMRGTIRPWIEVQVLDKYRNPVTCKVRPTVPETSSDDDLDEVEPTLSEALVDSLLSSLLPVCNTTFQSPLGQFHIEMSLLMSNNSIQGTTSAATDFSVAIFSNLVPAGPVEGIALQAEFKVTSALERVMPELLQVKRISKTFNVWATSFDDLLIQGCPKTTETYEAGSKYDKLEILGVFARSPSGLLHSSVEGTCTNGFGCQSLDVEPTLASVFLYDGSNPGRLDCVDESLCMQPGGQRHRYFEDTQSFFRDFRFPSLVASTLTVRLAVTSPFDGRHLYVDCAAVEIVSGEIAALEFVIQPSSKASAGEAIVVQPSLKLNDKFGNKILDNAIALEASMCLPCPCPCVHHQLPGSTHFGLPCVSNTASSWSPMGLTPAECVGEEPAMDGNVQQNEEGLVTFRNLRITTSGNAIALLFVTNVNSDVNITSHSLDVGACSPHVLKMNALSPLASVENPSDTGVSFCEAGKPCILEVKDLFGNLFIDAPITIEALLTPTPSKSLAGFSIGESCACTQRNAIYGVGAIGTDQSNTQDFDGFIDASYGMYCNSWDTYKADCAMLWPNCSAGLWCCRPWCYVSESCPSAVPDILVPGLFYSYEACSPDPDIFWKCPYKGDGHCPSRDAGTEWYEVESIFPPPSKLRGKNLVDTQGGRAIFTDLHTTHPGRYTMAFKGFFGSQLLFFSGDIGVTPLFARRLRIVTPPNNKTTTGNPLTQQPSVIMLDEYDNPVVYSKVCQAVTASVVSWSGKKYDNPGEGARFVFGQTTGDMDYYPAECDTDIQNDCIVTSNAQEGLASFSWMNIGGGPSQGIVLNFTTGCCNPDPNLCYCADPMTPNQVDSSRTEPVKETCSFVESPAFTLKMPVASITIETQPRALYRSGNPIDLAVSFKDKNGIKVAGGNDLVSATLYRQTQVGFELEDALVGDLEVEAEDGIGTFRNIALHKLRGEYVNGVYIGTFVINVTLMGFPDVGQVRSSPFTVQPDVPVLMLPWDDEAKRYQMPPDGFQYTRLATSVQEPNVHITFALYDKFGNFAPAPGDSVNATVVDMDLAPGGEISQGVVLEGTRTAAVNNELVVCCQTSLQWTGEFRLTFLFSVGGVSADLHFKVVPGPAARLYVSASFSSVIIAWESFYMELEVVDMYGNLVPTHTGFEIGVSSTMKELGDPLRDDKSIGQQVSGCSAVTCEGYVRFTDCRAKESPADASLYPNGRMEGEMTFTGKKDGSSTFPPLRHRFEILPPVVQLWVTGCLTKDREDAYNGTKGSGCSRDFLGRKQASKEPFFYYPRVELLDSLGHLATLSKLQIVATTAEPTPFCVNLFGDVVLIPEDGIVEFKTTGVTYLETGCQPYNWLVLRMRVTAEHRDPDHMELESVVVRNPEQQLVTVTQADGFSQSLHSHYTFAIDYPLTQLELLDAPEGGPWALTGLKLRPFVSVKLVYEFPDGVSKGIQFVVPQSSRSITCRIYKCTTPHWSNTCADDDQSPPGVLIGNTTILAVDGYATFENISIVTVGTFFLEITTQTESDASPIRVQMGGKFLEYVKITSGPLASLRILKSPPAWVVGTLAKRLEVELLDEYQNRLDCQYGECALPLYGFPELIGKRDWPLLPSSDLPVSVSIDQTRFGEFVPDITGRPQVCDSSANFVATEGMCSCLSGSMNVTALEGVATFDCLFVGMSGTALPLMLSAGGANLAVAPISVEPGSFRALYVVQNPSSKDHVAGEPVLFCPIGLSCVSLSVQMIDVCGNFLFVEGNNNVNIDVSVCPESAGIHGTTSSETALGRATFTDLRVSRAMNMPCEVADSLHFHDFDESSCMTKKTPYVFIFSALGISVASSEFLVDNGAMQTIAIVQQPGHSVQGRLLTVQPQVKLVDAFGNTVTVDSGGGFIVQAAMVTGEGCKRADQPVCWSNCDGTAIGGTCYKFFTLPSTFDQAVAACEDWGGELLTVTTAQTNLDVVAPLTGGASAWIGLKWEDEKQDWMWRDEAGSNTDDYANWDEGFPPLFDQRLTACVAAKASLWETHSCERLLPYVCGNDASDEAQNECNCCSKITGTSTVLVKGGFAVYTDLVVASEPGSGFRMIFSALPVSQSFGANILCDGPCDCTPRAMVTDGIFDDGIGEYENSITCKWMISTMATIPGGLRDTQFGEAEISLWFTKFDTEPGYDFVYVNECTSEECPDPVLIQRLDGSTPSHSGPKAVGEGTIYSTPTGFLQLVFQTDMLKKNFQGFRAEWNVKKAPTNKIVAPAPEWQRASGISEQFTVLPRTSMLQLLQQPSYACAGQALVYQPHVLLLDRDGDQVVQEPIHVFVSVISSSPAVQLLGTTQQLSIDGHVTFTNLEISTASSQGIRLRFQAVSGTPPVPLSVDSDYFPVTPKAHRMFIVARTQPQITVMAGEVLADVILRMQDENRYQVFTSNTAVRVVLEGAPDAMTTPAGSSFLPILGMTVQTALNGSVTFDQLRISWASPSTKLIFHADHVLLQAVSTE